MSLFNPQFQVLSDLHLETPISQPSYSSFRIDVQASHVFLLGDIGLVKGHGLFEFLERLLKLTPNVKIYYVFGNHEAYQLTMNAARQAVEDFASRMTRMYGGRFFFLHRTRHDINRTITILGCTLWTEVLPMQAVEAQRRLTDFNETRGIRDWTLSDHLDEHHQDVAWLNEQVSKIANEEPERQIIILTHHSPTVDARANDSVHVSSSIKSAFVTDLSSQHCWMSKEVRMWAFGHTHYSCACWEEDSGKLVVANQKGYSGLGAGSGGLETRIVEAVGERWSILPQQSDATLMTKSARPSHGPKKPEWEAKAKGAWGKISRFIHKRRKPQNEK
ncbi:hypothetical protein NA57DRAFT_71172 [Rhizodiscina lignyota]|uniref:Calcineurin-like phosphoesterase domain-containing protein n=1 Tax=Rhizodiscina lignyota TaxID=1504668 RepID=A0A9P4INX9_9PEZI|nr:hypothetical protein NA57DRAFT_71172 [Rhizodiscina lignyota]